MPNANLGTRQGLKATIKNSMYRTQPHRGQPMIKPVWCGGRYVIRSLSQLQDFSNSVKFDNVFYVLEDHKKATGILADFTINYFKDLNKRISEIEEKQNASNRNTNALDRFIDPIRKFFK